jgi:hypothetical protein
MWKAYLNEFNPPINHKLLYSLVTNTMTHVCSKETYFSLDVSNRAIFNEKKTTNYYSLSLCSLPFTASTVNTPVIKIVKKRDIKH